MLSCTRDFYVVFVLGIKTRNDPTEFAKYSIGTSFWDRVVPPTVVITKAMVIIIRYK